MKCIAIIPARGGSKRIPRKNIRDFLGKPIIAYSIETALASGLFEEVMVSTDDAEIAAISKHYGARVPFMRSIATSDDFATTADVLSEVINKYEQTGSYYDYACCLYPTAPLLQVKSLRESFRLLKKEKYETVFPVLRYSYPIWRSLCLKDSKVAMNWPEHLNSRSQDMPPSFHDAGQFYWLHVRSFIKSGKLFTDNSGALELEDIEAQDIDTLADWKMAELKYKFLQEKQPL
ncbi:pseudaminic acid cytidylyltransferase [Pontibacter sp. SGAir0037]|uniref:pseudaminic acid cytidylyltransferase n=1 Tax=Pontibacter sp. SGAir0037 TaxID=2571030 RepID=UPI0010CD4BC9|nr:pseudaminic acid cytidylyltransferase [Pontibacter sp. SGAir0037]QCR22996.1 pseudaminic acid cytidylyltransferase [Pontibacter sp. SGAir0037]